MVNLSDSAHWRDLGLARAYAMQGDAAKAQGGLSGFPHSVEGRRSRTSPSSSPPNPSREASIIPKQAAIGLCDVDHGRSTAAHIIR